MSSVPQSNPLRAAPVAIVDLNFDRGLDVPDIVFPDVDQRIKKILESTVLKDSGLSTQEALNTSHSATLAVTCAVTEGSSHVIGDNYRKKMQLSSENSDQTRTLLAGLVQATLKSISSDESPEEMTQRVKAIASEVEFVTGVLARNTNERVKQVDSIAVGTLSELYNLNEQRLASAVNFADALHVEAKNLDQAAYNKAQLEQSHAYANEKNAIILKSEERKCENLAKRAEDDNALHIKESEQAIKSRIAEERRKNYEAAQEELKLRMEEFDKARIAAETDAKRGKCVNIILRQPKIVPSVDGSYVVVPGQVRFTTTGYFSSKKVTLN